MADTLAPGTGLSGSDNGGTLPGGEAAVGMTEPLRSPPEPVHVVEEPLPPLPPIQPVGGPVWRAWREGTLTRVAERAGHAGPDPRLGAGLRLRQQLFTRLVDQQAHTVLDSVRGADKAAESRAATP